MGHPVYWIRKVGMDELEDQRKSSSIIFLFMRVLLVVH